MILALGENSLKIELILGLHYVTVNITNTITNHIRSKSIIIMPNNIDKYYNYAENYQCKRL